MTGINERERYQRQQLIEGWNQQKLTDATVTIVGSASLAQYVALPLAALGVGSVRLVDATPAHNERFLDLPIREGPRVHGLEQILRRINPTIAVRGIASSVVSDTSTYFLEKSSIIVEATNDPRSKAITLGYANEKGIPVIVASSKAKYGKVMLYHRGGEDVRYLLPEFDEEEQDEVVSMVLGGLIAEEVKKLLMGEEKLEKTIYYNLTNPLRFTYHPGDYGRNGSDFTGKSVLMVGAGALGNFVGLGLAKLGIGRVDVIDPDGIEDTNLNRQVLFYNAVGRLKATALSKKIKVMGNGKVDSEAFKDTFTEKSEFPRRYDAIFDCVDNFTVRAVIHDYAVGHKIPLISGGTDFKEGQLAIYVPGKTACLDHQMEIHRLGKEAEEQRRQAGCLLAPNPSVIMSNQVIGGMMVAEVRTVFDSKIHGEPFNGNMKYSSLSELRLGMTPLKTVCACEPKGGITIEPREVPAEREETDIVHELELQLQDEPDLPEKEDEKENEKEKGKEGLLPREEPLYQTEGGGIEDEDEIAQLLSKGPKRKKGGMFDTFR